MKQTESLSEFSCLSEYIRLYPNVSYSSLTDSRDSLCYLHAILLIITILLGIVAEKINSH